MQHKTGPNKDHAAQDGRLRWPTQVDQPAKLTSFKYSFRHGPQ
uniref:Uncharacterized protein n=1 Tax=Anguilla anguilla TaxID=7936 RepID=A0A0E9T9Z6_ANGAN